MTEVLPPQVLTSSVDRHHRHPPSPPPPKQPLGSPFVKIQLTPGVTRGAQTTNTLQRNAIKLIVKIQKSRNPENKKSRNPEINPRIVK